MTYDTEAQIRKLKRSKNLPAHIAIIMDGNGRWAQKKRLPRLAGHRASRESVRAVVRSSAKIGIKYLTLYAFSLENWNRPRAEVNGLMGFFRRVLREEHEELNDNGVQLRVMGRMELLQEQTRKTVKQAISKLAHNERLVLTLALSYGGRAEIIDAARAAARDSLKGKLDPEKMDENLFRNYFYDPDLPDPDLLIRTSGEMRVSNFLLWQIAYSEIFVTSVLWPDFREKDLIESIKAYQARDRRYGLIT